MRKLALLLVLSGCSTALAGTPVQVGGSSAFARVEMLPIDGLQKVTQQDGSVVFLSTNRRFAFVGTMYDLWRGEALTLGVATSQRLELERNGVSLEKIAMPLGEALSGNTLFIAPECDDCRELLAAALETTAGDLNVVLLASTQAGQRANSVVWCAGDRGAALRAIYLEGRAVEAREVPADCDRFGLMLADQAAMLFGIGQLPLFLDERGIGYVGEDAIRAVAGAGHARQRTIEASQ